VVLLAGCVFDGSALGARRCSSDDECTAFGPEFTCVRTFCQGTGPGGCSGAGCEDAGLDALDVAGDTDPHDSPADAPEVAEDGTPDDDVLADTADTGPCPRDFVDLDGEAANGCEYFCPFDEATDVPDPAFEDRNCDGMDGDRALGLFVASTGDDDNPGTPGRPLRTVGTAIGRASGLQIPAIYIAEGTYQERIVLANGVSLYGGYASDGSWARSAEHVTTLRTAEVVAGRLIGVQGASITEPTEVALVEIRTGVPNVPGTTNYGLACLACPALVLTGDLIEAGPGADGAAGAPGASGDAGANGSPGGDGTCSNGNGAGGAGGVSTCDRAGGSGGAGGAEGDNPGEVGGEGGGGTVGGASGDVADCRGRDGGVGQPGDGGGDGGDGPGGASGGEVVDGFWTGHAGMMGGDGAAGNGGGGGGGGGGQGEHGCCALCDDGGGNGGGGGGAGGCVGGGGGGGQAGGGSFGVFLVDSGGATLLHNIIRSADGGDGGAGAAGGAGGAPGEGGAGATSCNDQIGRGGAGGRGGVGGAGGSGGGGAGGDSFGLTLIRSDVTQIDNDLGFGAAGAGGDSPDNPGGAGFMGPFN